MVIPVIVIEAGIIAYEVGSTIKTIFDYYDKVNEYQNKTDDRGKYIYTPEQAQQKALLDIAPSIVSNLIPGPEGDIAIRIAYPFVKDMYGGIISGIFQKLQQNSSSIKKINIETDSTNVNDIKTLMSPFVLKGSVSMDVTINNTININAQKSKIYLKELSKTKVSLQSIISDVTTITKKIVQPVTNNLSKLINSGIANISDISIGKTSVGSKIIYFGNKVNELINKEFDDISGVVNRYFLNKIYAY